MRKTRKRGGWPWSSAKVVPNNGLGTGNLGNLRRKLRNERPNGQKYIGFNRNSYKKYKDNELNKIHRNSAQRAANKEAARLAANKEASLLAAAEAQIKKLNEASTEEITATISSVLNKENKIKLIKATMNGFFNKIQFMDGHSLTNKYHYKVLPDDYIQNYKEILKELETDIMSKPRGPTFANYDRLEEAKIALNLLIDIKGEDFPEFKERIDKISDLYYTIFINMPNQFIRTDQTGKDIRVLIPKTIQVVEGKVKKSNGSNMNSRNPEDYRSENGNITIDSDLLKTLPWYKVMNHLIIIDTFRYESYSERYLKPFKPVWRP
jgi:DNA-binding ferritin-like protein (Dps family)